MDGDLIARILHVLLVLVIVVPGLIWHFRQRSTSDMIWDVVVWSCLIVGIAILYTYIAEPQLILPEGKSRLI